MSIIQENRKEGVKNTIIYLVGILCNFIGKNTLSLL